MTTKMSTKDTLKIVAIVFAPIGWGLLISGWVNYSHWPGLTTGGSIFLGVGLIISLIKDRLKS